MLQSPRLEYLARSRGERLFRWFSVRLRLERRGKKLQTDAGRESMLLMEREVRIGTRFKMEEHSPVNDVQSKEQSDKDNLMV